MGNTKFGFANFKAFGPKIQRFNTKPITLVYGPNSVGKSSLLHANLYIQYLNKNTAIGSSFVFSNFAGDRFDLGHFGNFVHKHDVNSSVIFETTITDDNEISKILFQNFSKIKLLGIEGLTKNIDSYSDDELLNEISLRLDSYRLKENTLLLNSRSKKEYKDGNSLMRRGIKKYITSINIGYFLSKSDRGVKLYDMLIKQNDSDSDMDELSSQLDKYMNEIDEIVDIAFEECVNSKLTLCDIIYRQDGGELDAIDKAILYFFDMEDSFEPVILLGLLYMSTKNMTKHSHLAYTPDQIKILVVVLRKYKYISSICEIKIEQIIGNYGQEHTINMHIDNERVLTCNVGVAYIDKYTLEINCSSEFVKEIMPNVTEAYVKTTRFELFSLFNEKLLLFSLDENERGNIMNLSSSLLLFLDKYYYPAVQYLGPLRFYPQRNTTYYGQSIKQESKAEYLNYVTSMKEWLQQIDEKELNKIREFSPFKQQLYMIFLQYRSGILLKMLKSHLNKHYKSPLLLDSLNSLFGRSVFNVRTGSSALTNEQMWQNLASSRELQDSLNSWLSDDEKLKTTYRVKISAPKMKRSFWYRLLGHTSPRLQIKFLDIKKNTEVYIRDMGLGISQILPILISTLSMKDTKIVIEQPELHLHPAVQCEMADEFIRSFKENKNQFMIETHSEHLLLRIMKRMRHTAEGKIDSNDVLALTPDDVCLLYVDSDGENTFINELELDRDGTLLDPWPNGFFEEGHKERFD